MTSHRPELHAVVEVGEFIAPAWISLPPRPWPRFVRLSGDTPGCETALVIAVASTYGGGDAGSRESAQALVKKFPKVLPGGIATVLPSRQILPSCCCGLETWAEWKQVLHTQASPWMGHDPAPLIEALDEEVHIWSDGAMGEKPNGEAPIRFTRSEFELAVEGVSRDLEAFLIPLRHWLDDRVPMYAKRIIERFRSNFIHTPTRRR